VPNGGVRVKKSFDGSDSNSASGSGTAGGNDKIWTRPDYQPSSTAVGGTPRYMDKQVTSTGIAIASAAGGQNKTRQYDDNFIPLDLGDDFENQQAMLDEEEDVVMSDQEMEEDMDEEEEEEDVSSDGVESAAEDGNDDVDDDGVGEEVGLEGTEDEEEMDEEDEYNMYQDQLRYEAENDDLY